MPPKERAEVLHRIADGVEARVPELAAVETRDNGSLLRSMRNSVMPRVARNFRFFADHLLTLGEDKDYDGFAEHVRVGPQRRGGRDHAVERSVDARHLAGGSGAGGRQRRDPQAAGVGAAHRLDARRHRARRRPARRRVQRAAGDRRGSGRRPHRPSRRWTASRSPDRCRPASSWRRPPARTSRRRAWSSGASRRSSRSPTPISTRS